MLRQINRLINKHPDAFDTFSIDLLTINLLIQINRLINKHPDYIFSIDLLTIKMLRQINRLINKHPDAFDTFSIDLTIKHAKANQSTD